MYPGLLQETKMNMSEQAPIKVMIVDDHPVVRNGIMNMLLIFDDIALLGEAGGGLELLAQLQADMPDVILMDMVMPGMNGLETTRAVLAQYPDLKIVILTTFPQGDVVRDALEAGAVGFLTKNAEIDTLADAIRAAHAGQTVLAPEATTALMQVKTRSPKLGHDLSKRELEVLALLVEGLSNREIAERLTISPATVKHHVSACISKLGANNRGQAAVLALELQIVSHSQA
jgi:NarL family two-component system response regulator LiaR